MARKSESESPDHDIDPPPIQKLSQKFPHPIFGQLNLKEWFAFHRVHALDHIQQIDKIKADPNYPSA